MNKRRAALAFLVGGLIHFLVLALDPGRALTQYGHDIWTRKDGLPQDSVEAITQTTDGYLWIGTQEGLARFDGVRFAVFDRKSTGVLEGDYILGLHADPDGRLWIGTSDGLYAYADSTFTRLTPAGLKQGVGAIHRDRRGTLWLGIREGPLSVLDGGRIRPFMDRDGAKLSHVTSITERDNGSVCFAAKDVQCVEEGRLRPYAAAKRLPGLQTPQAIAFDRRTGLWVGTDAGAAQLGAGIDRLWTPREGLPGDFAAAFQIDSHGDLWVGTVPGGVSRFRDGRFEVFTERHGLSSDQVKALFEDREGSLWIGTNGGGLNRLRDRRLEPFSVQEGLSHPYVHSVLEGRAGEL